MDSVGASVKLVLFSFESVSGLSGSTAALVAVGSGSDSGGTPNTDIVDGFPANRSVAPSTTHGKLVEQYFINSCGNDIVITVIVNHDSGDFGFVGPITVGP